MIALRGLNELRESLSVLSPIEVAAVNDNASNGGTMSTNPLGGAVNYNVGTVIDRASEVASSTEGVVNLCNNVSVFLIASVVESQI